MTALRISKKIVHLIAYILLLIPGIYFIGMRGEDIGSDTHVYFKYFDFVKYGESFIGAERIEIGFYGLTKLISNFTDSKNVYLSIIFLIQFIGISSAIFKKNDTFKPYFFIALIWLSCPFFYSFTLNVLRQGLAFVFVVYAIDAKLQNKKFSPYILLSLGTLFHYATVLYIFCFLISELKQKTVVFIWAWLLAVLLAFSGWAERIFQWILVLIVGNNPYYATYLDSSFDADYSAGFKIEFVIFSILPIAYYFLLKKYSYENVTSFSFVFSIYLIMNIVYLCFASIPYSDRFALASWVLIPLMINFNFLKKVGLLNLFKVSITFSSIFVFSYYLFFLQN